MAQEPSRPLLRLKPQEQQERPVGNPRSIPGPEPFPQARQSANFTPKFDRLAEVLQRDPAGLELRSDPTALAPERLLVFEVRGAIGPFAAAVRRFPGLELVDEEELVADESDKAPSVYLLVPDARALREIASLWRRWQRGQLVTGETAWRHVFSLLRDLRPWGPNDRIGASESEILAAEVIGLADEDLVKLEVELVYRSSAAIGMDQEDQVRSAVLAGGGRVLSRVRLDEIAYHAMLIETPVNAVRDVLERNIAGLAGLEPVMYIRPQSIASTIEVADTNAPDRPYHAAPLGEPILALLDGVPVAAHALLTEHLIVDDQFALEPATPVTDRVHGTAMASLIVHGDRNQLAEPIPRRIHVVPVMGAGDDFPKNRLIVDLIYNAVVTMREGPLATAPEIIIVNVSLGNPRRPFHGQISAWARLIDRLAYRYGLLFIVSAGNRPADFGIPAYVSRTAFEDSDADHRAKETLRAVGAVAAERRIISPAETVNGLTVGACNEDWVPTSERAASRVNVDPYYNLVMTNPSSALGPGFAASVKPDFLMPGGRERLRYVRSHAHIDVSPAKASRSAGLKVAAPPRDGYENVDGFTGGTSAAAALASRTAHRIHDALETAYWEAFLGLSHIEKAVLLKALLAHPAKWPDEAAAMIRDIVGPAGGHHVRQKDNIRRFLGFGYVDAEAAISCAADRATFWAVGTIQPNKVAAIAVPVPPALGGKARPHSLSATVAWLTPTTPGRKSYRSVKLRLLEPDELSSLRVKAHSNQPDGNQTNRGTVFTRCWSGDRAAVVASDMHVHLTVQRDPDQGTTVDDPVTFAVAVTLSMPGVVEIYEQARQRLAVAPRTPI